MNPEDELMDELDPMPGEEEESAPELPEATEPDAPMEMDPRQRQALVQQMILEDPELKDVFMAGMMAKNQPQQPQEEQQDPRALIEGDPGLELLYGKIEQIEQERNQARMETQAVQTLGQFIAQNDVPDEIAKDMMAMPALGLAIAQDPQFAGLMTKLVKTAGGVRKHTEAVASSIKPPATVGQTSAMAGDPGLDAKAMNLKKTLGTQKGYKNFSDQDWKDLAKD